MTDTPSPSVPAEIEKQIQIKLGLNSYPSYHVDDIRDLCRSSYLAGQRAREWQPISTAPEAERVWVYAPNAGCMIAIKTTHPSDGSVWWTGEARIYGPTHWQPLPDPPVPERDDTPERTK